MPGSPPYKSLRRSRYDKVEDHSAGHDDNMDTRGLLSPDTPYMYSNSESTAYHGAPSPYSPPYGYQGKPSPNPSQTEDHGASYAQEGYRKHHGTWTIIAILLLSVYSTIFSAIWVGLAIAGPAYAFIGLEPGALNPTVASTLVAAFAKSIELSFVTVFVAFLGQFLSRKALGKTSPGITLADMQLRSFLLQPGLILGSWHSFHYTARTALGALTMLAAFVSLLYTTASDALVSPKPDLKRAEQMSIGATVRTNFANNTFITNMCPTPINVTEIDAEAAGTTCSGIEHAGQAYHNYMQWLSSWEAHDDSPNSARPPPSGMLFDNTTAIGQWLYNTGPDILQATDLPDRIINNVTMAMPHSAVYGAVMDNIPWRRFYEGDRDAQIIVDAQVTAPAINVLCAAVTQAEVEPLVFSEWPEVRQLLENNATLLDAEYPNWPFDGVNREVYDQDWRRVLRIPADWANTSAVDDIFGFGPRDSSRPPPVFPKLPLQLQSVYNFTSTLQSDSVYVLFHANDSLVAGTETRNHNFTMCSLSMSTEQGCSTRLQVSVSGGRIQLVCGSATELGYTSSVPARRAIPEWVQVAKDWGTATALGHGLTDGAPVNSRLLSQLILYDAEARSDQPTIAEALAVLAGCTALISSQDAPVDQSLMEDALRAQERGEVFDISDHLNRQQMFETRVQVSGYMSGTVIRWQRMFNAVLVIAFLVNCFCLVYFLHIIRIRGLVNDFIEPQNMFALALHSPADRRLAGTSAGGPDRHHMRERWFIKEDWNHQVFIGDGRRRRGHSSWMSHRPSNSGRVQMTEFEVGTVQEGKPPKSYKPGLKESINRNFGLNIFMGQNDHQRRRSQ